MRHVFVASDTPLHRLPPSLKSVSAPEVPIRIRKCLPVDFTIVSNVQGMNSVNDNEWLSNEKSIKHHTYEREYMRLPNSNAVCLPDF